VGIDVSKDWLDVHVLPADERLRVSNTCAGIRQLKRWFTRFELALVVVEATGKWHRPVQRSLVASTIPVAVVDPFRVRMFARAHGILAKTDRLDARVLALFAAMMTPSQRPPGPQALAELAELVTARMSAVEAQTALKNQRSAATVKFLQRQLDRRIERGDTDIAALDAAILKRIEAEEDLARRYAILTSTERRLHHRGNSDRLSRRAWQPRCQTDRHAGRPCSDRRSVRQTRRYARRLRRAPARATGPLSCGPLG
jgi:transposase